MHQVTMSARRAYDLGSVLNSFSPAEAAKLNGEDSIRNLKTVDKLVDEVLEACKDFSEKMDKVNVRQSTVVDAARAEAKSYESLGEEEKKAALELLTAKTNEKLSELGKELEAELGLEEAAKKDVYVEIKSDERMKFLKDILPKLVEKYAQRKALVETVEAIETAQEV